MYVAVIGCGPSGISVLSSFNQAELTGQTIPEIVCFEKQDVIGGLWNFSYYTGTDQYGEQCHNSMYRYLWSNGPKEVLEYEDYSFKEHFGRAIPSFPPRTVLNEYNLGRAKKNNVDRFVQLNTVVRNVEKKGDQFSVFSQNLKTREEKREMFDYLVVATGHFSVPNQPAYPGMDGFNGRVMHSHDFRDATSYKGKKMLLVGNSYSAEDIAMQCIKYGVQHVTLSYRSKPTGFKWPEGIKEIPQLEKFVDGKFHFKDGTTDTFDVIMFCTGYRYHYPFLPEGLRPLHPQNKVFVDELYKGLVLNKDPRVIFIGMHDQYFSYTEFEVQGHFVRDLIFGKIDLMTEKEREADIKLWRDRFATVNDPHGDIDFQMDYISDLLKVSISLFIIKIIDNLYKQISILLYFIR